MRQFTSPTYALLVKCKTIDSTDRIFITFSDEFRKRSITITECQVVPDEKGTILEFDLTQEQTGMFRHGNPISVQVNWINALGRRFATEIKEVRSEENLIKEVIT